MSRHLSHLSTAALLVATITFAGCAKKEAAENDTTGANAAAMKTDTTITKTQVQDTTVVRHDTTVRTDTVKQTHHGADTTRRGRDTTHRRP